MNNETTDGAAVRVPPPLSYLAVLVAGIALNELIWPLPFAFSGSIRLAIALAIAVPSIALGAGALRLFRATGQDPNRGLPHQRSFGRVSTGLHAIRCT